jgi:predicted O-linked N-acetylglucosamine transferase (SPINDLY family)
MNSWGHPETSGLSTIDYFLSAENFEPETGQDNYSERLVCLPGLANPYTARSSQGSTLVLGEWGIDTDRPILICPGTPFKYQPEFDHVFVDIARNLPSCQMIFFRLMPEEVSTKLRDRLSAVFAASGMNFEQNVRFLPTLKLDQFHALLRRADVMLDTIGFSGYNNAIQAIECSLPIVAREGRYLRGRLATGILRRLGMTELIAATEEDYVRLVVKVARDPSLRDDLRSRIVERREVLFEDMAPIRSLEELLLRSRAS